MGPLFGVQLALGLSNPPSGIYQVWEECRTIYGTGGPFLFGAFSIADAMYAPVVLRFRSYDTKISAAAQRYCAAVEAMPEVQCLY